MKWTSTMSLFTALAIPAQARIVYTPVNVTLPANGFYPIDLNHDGITDFHFHTLSGYVGCGLGIRYVYALWIAPNLAGGGIVGTYDAAASQSGVRIDFSQSFYGSGSLMYQKVIGPGCGGDQGQWYSVSKLYLGLEFLIAGQVHYGWGQLSTQAGGTNTLYGFAYETIPGMAIKTGQMFDSPDELSIGPGSAESEDSAPTASVAVPFSNAPQPQSPDAAKGQIITFDAPGAGTGPGQGTFVTNSGTINPAGAITGYYCDAINCHGFLRAPDGTITTIDPPGSTATSANAINPAGTLTGSYFDPSGSGCHGFLRDRDGTFTIFDPAGAGTCTVSNAINPAGAIAGDYFDLSGVIHGFLRARDGTFTTFDAPGAGTGPGQGSIPFGLNPAGAITGYVVDASNVGHSFLRARDGTFATFDAPGAGTGAGQGTFAYSLNPGGVITGYYVDASDVAHGFLRKRQCDRDGHEKDCEGSE